MKVNYVQQVFERIRFELLITKFAKFLLFFIKVFWPQWTLFDSGQFRKEEGGGAETSPKACRSPSLDDCYTERTSEHGAPWPHVAPSTESSGSVRNKDKSSWIVSQQYLKTFWERHHLLLLSNTRWVPVGDSSVQFPLRAEQQLLLDWWLKTWFSEFRGFVLYLDNDVSSLCWFFPPFGALEPQLPAWPGWVLVETKKSWGG